MTNFSKQKGNIWESRLATWFRTHGIRAWKDDKSGGGSKEKGDIGNDIDMTIESKAGKQIKLMEWWRQVRRSAAMHRNAPVLFIHEDTMPQDEWLVVMSSYDWIEFVKGQKEVDTSYKDPTAVWELRNLVEAAKKVIKRHE